MPYVYGSSVVRKKPLHSSDHLTAPRSRFLREKPNVARLPYVTELACSLPCPQEPATLPYSKSNVFLNQFQRFLVS
jgi:hypothetical protein